jgi:hypothetical protein
METRLRHIIREHLRNSLKNEGFVIYEENGEGLEILKSLVKKVEKNLRRAYLEVTGNELDLPRIEVKLDPTIKNGKIGGFSHPDHNGDNGVLGIKPKALNNMDYLEDVITHELIHAAVGEDLPDHKEHSGLFNRLAEKMGLPDHRRD